MKLPSATPVFLARLVEGAGFRLVHADTEGVSGPYAALRLADAERMAAQFDGATVARTTLGQAVAGATREGLTLVLELPSGTLALATEHELIDSPFFQKSSDAEKRA